MEYTIEELTRLNKDSLVSIIIRERIPIVTAPNDAAKNIMKIVGKTNTLKKEYVWVFAADSSNRIIKSKRIAVGTVDRCQVFPREVFHYLIKSRAVGFYLAHNHPGGSVRHGVEDIALVKNLQLIGHHLQIPLIDSFVFSGDKQAISSYKESENS